MAALELGAIGAPAAAFALLLIAPQRALGQACCAGGGAYLPARLKLHEDALVAIQARSDDALGTLSPTGAEIPNPRGASELDLQQDVLGAIRVADRGQIGIDLPIVETRRTADRLSDFGGGLGDASLAFRYDFLYPAESAHVPGLALGAGVTLPSGRAPEQAHGRLGADSTGTGAWQGLITAEVEQALGHWVFTVDVLVAVAAARTVGTVHEQLGPTFSGFGATGYVFPHEVVLALVLSTSQSLDAVINGSAVPHTGRGLTTASLAAGVPLSAQWRLQSALYGDLPTLGRNRPTGLGGTLTMVFAWI